MNILIFDSDTTVQETIQWTFYHEQSISFQLANTIKEATQLLLTTAIDLIIMDAKYLLDQENGIISICQNALHKVSILCTISESELNAPGIQLQLGAQDYIFKPFSAQDLMFRVRKLCHINPPTVLLVSAYEDVIQQVTWALSNSGISVWATQDTANLKENYYLRQARAIICDSQFITAQNKSFLDQAKKLGPVLTLAPLGALSAEQTASVLDSDDFVNIPFSPIHLETRLKKLLRRPQTPPPFISEEPTERKEMDQLKIALHHEIRNPLTSILIGAQALAHQFQDGTTEKNVLNTIETSSHRIKTIMDALSNNQNFEVEEYTDGIQMLKLT